ncbi:MAG: DUF58 domain-containing protein [Xanthomonadales bacterium]|nr:DUF58 domain-containing protein [Xanthomonadales bacterium]
MATTTVSTDELIRLRHLARNLVLGGRRPVSSVIAGAHLSRFRGRGVDYLESRHYEPGDDIRNLDWRVTARTGRPHTKIFQEERERPVIVLLDLEAAMFFGTQRRLKAVLAAEIAALVGWAAVRRGDRIGGLVYWDSLNHQEIRPRGGRRGMMRYLGIIEQAFEARASTTASYSEHGLCEALIRLRRVLRPGSLVIMVSDFMSMDDECDRHLSRIRQHNDLAAFQVLDALEREIPPPGVYPVADGRGDQAVLDLRARGSRQMFEAGVVGIAQRARDRLAGFGIPVVPSDPREEAIDVVAQLFAKTRGARR